jgi:hypothetical protein
MYLVSFGGYAPVYPYTWEMSLMLLDAWGENGGSADLNGGEAVGVSDLLMLIDAWESC